jgi:transcriptional regulator with XRE-family HTH domain
MNSLPIQPLPQDLAAWRKAKGISLRQIVDATKIGLRYLEAIERGAFEELPGGAYREGYIRQYARAIGDADNVLWDYYCHVFVPLQLPAAAPPPETPVCRLREMVWSFLGLASKTAADLERRGLA